MTLKERLLADLDAATKAQDKVRIDTIRMVHLRIQGAEMRAKRALGDAELAEVVGRCGQQLRESIVQLGQAGRPTQPAEAALKILGDYLPQQRTNA